MSRVSTYLNFDRNAEAAFEFYRGVFGSEFLGPVVRFADLANGPELPEEELNLIMHVELPILGGHVLMGSDMLQSQGHVPRRGNTMSINLELDDRVETEHLFESLSDNANDAFGLIDMPWGAYWGTCEDHFGIRWMLNCPSVPG